MNHEADPPGLSRERRRVKRLEDRTERVISRVAIVRLCAFLTALLCGIAAGYDRLWQPYGPIAAVGGMVFLIAVYLHRRPYNLLPRIQERGRTAEISQWRAQHEFGRIVEDGSQYLDETRPELRELQIFGRHSLYQLVNRSGLPWGRDRLANLLQDGVSCTEVIPRQNAARELSRLPILRRRVEVESRLVDVSTEDIEQLLKWAESEPDINGWLTKAFWFSLILVPTTLIQLVLTLGFDLVTMWQASFLAQLLLFGLTTPKLTAYYIHLIGNPKERPIVALRTVFQRVERVRFQSDYLKRLQRDWRGDAGQTRPSKRIEQFESVVDSLAVRHSALLYSVLAICFLWDIIQCRRLETWRGRFGPSLRRDLEALAEFECLSSVGGFAAEHPEYAWPTIRPGQEQGRPIEGLALGHPLIPASIRKTNDFTLSEMGHLLLVTGSNMSGKSTFLRIIGMNARLAMGGLPICGRALDMVECTLSTSIQVVDSPEQGLSRFYAEVKRLARVIRCVEGAGADGRVPCLYLVDEMLSGTNSRERSIASRAIVRRLVEAPASFGLVTTHDLALVAVESELPGRVICAHFADQFDGESMSFDYLMKPGVATTTNALQVLRLEGIDVEDDGC